MKRRKAGPSGIVEAPLDPRTQARAKEEGLASVKDSRLRTYEPGDNVHRFLDLLGSRVSRPLAVSLTACVHCGLCAESCHYFLARPDDPTMTPVWKADQIRKVFKRHVDWTGRVAPWWVKAGSPRDDQDLNRLKNIVFGACSACRRCTYNCPMGVRHGAPGPVHPGPPDRARRRPRGRLQRQPRPVGDGQPDGRLRTGLPGDLGVDARRRPGRARMTTVEIPVDKEGLRHPLHDQPAGDQVRPPLDRPGRQDLPPGRGVLDHAEMGLGPDQLRPLFG